MNINLFSELALSELSNRSRHGIDCPISTNLGGDQIHDQ